MFTVGFKGLGIVKRTRALGFGCFASGLRLQEKLLPVEYCYLLQEARTEFRGSGLRSTSKF